MTQFPTGSYVPSNANVQPHRGTMILVFGILSWVVCVIFGVVAWIMGNSDLRAMAEGRMDRSGEGLTKAGKIVGMIHVILCLIMIPLLIVLFVIGAFAGSATQP